MQNKPSVIILENSMDTTGAFKAIFQYAQYAKEEFDFIFIFPKGSKLVLHVKNAGFQVEQLPFVEIGKSIKKLVTYSPYLLLNTIRLLRLIRKHDVQLVHVNDFYNLVGATGKLMGSKYKLLTHIRFMPDRFPKLLLNSWFKAAIKYSEHLVCVSYAVAKCLPKHKKIKVIYDTIPAITQVSSHKKKSSSDDNIYLLYLAHYIPGKGQDNALEAFHRAYQQDVRLRLKFVGGDMGLEKNIRYKNQLQKKAKSLGIAKVVDFAGPSSNIAIEFEQADIALNFSESESFSFTCLEALAHGVPLIATDSGGPAELFEHGKSGFLVSRRDIQSMADAILYLAKDDKVRKSYASEGINYVSHKFALNNTFESMKKVYKASLF